jgi:excinuclease UvrABC nuclease subunit
MNTFIRKGVVVLALGSMCFAQSATTSTTTKKKTTTKRVVTKAPAATEQDIQQLKDMLQQQQQQIQQLQQQMAQRDQQLAAAEAAAKEAQSKATQVETTTNEQKDTTNKLASDVNDLKMVQTNAAASLQETQKDFAEKMSNPSAIRYKGITLTPGGFIEAAGIWRQHTEQTDVLSTFNGIPYSGQPAGNLTEFRGTARQSRLSPLAETKVGHTKLTG